MKKARILFILCIFSCLFSYSLIQASEPLLKEGENSEGVIYTQDSSHVELVEDDSAEGIINIDTYNNTQRYDEKELETTEGNYAFYSDFFAEEGTAEEVLKSQSSDMIDRIEFITSNWEGTPFEFLVDQHYAYAAYENADIELVDWENSMMVDGIETSFFQLSNGEILYLRMSNKGEYVSARSILPSGEYYLDITDESGNVYDSAAIIITDMVDSVTELELGEETTFNLGQETRVYSLTFHNLNNAVSEPYTLYLSSEGGEYTVQCLWDNNSWITGAIADIAYVTTGEQVYYPVEALGEGRAFFVIKSVDNGDVSGTIRISNDNEIRQIKSVNLVNQIFYEDLICDDGFDPSNFFALTVVYENGEEEILRNWIKDRTDKYYYTYSASGKPISIYLTDEYSQKVDLPSALSLPETGMYAWSVEYQFDGDNENRVLSTSSVEFAWKNEKEDLTDEAITYEFTEGQNIFFTVNVTETMYLEAIAEGTDETSVMLESIVFSFNDGRWVQDQKNTHWNEEDKYILLTPGDHIVFLNALVENNTTLQIDKCKSISEMVISDLLPQELTVTQLLSNSEKYLPTTNISVSITYDDGTSEELSEWQVKQRSYYTHNKYGKEITLELSESVNRTQVFWGMNCIPVPGTYCWVASSDEITVSSQEHTITDDVDTVINLVEETELGSRGKYVATFDIEEKGIYQIGLSFDTEKEEVANIYRLNDDTLDLVKTRFFENDEIVSATLQEGKYYIALSDEQALPGSVFIEKREAAVMVALAGVDQVIVYEQGDDYDGSDDNLEDESATFLKGLTVEITYEGGSKEFISLDATDYYLRLSNGEILSFGVVNLNEEGKPVSIKAHGAREYYGLDEKIKPGSYAMVAVLDNEPRLDSYIPYIVKLPPEFLEVPESYAIVDEYGSCVATVTDEKPQSYIKIEVDKSNKYVLYSKASDDSDTFACLYIYDEDLDCLIPIASDDDGGNGNNFKIVYNLEKGSTYFLECSTSEGDEAEYPVYLREKTITVSDEVEELTYDATDLPEIITLTAEAETTRETDLQYQWYMKNDSGEFQIVEGAIGKTYVIDSPKSETYYCEVTDGNDMDQIYVDVNIENDLRLNEVLDVCADENGNATIKVDATVKKGELRYFWQERKYDSEEDNYNYIAVQEEGNRLNLSGITEIREYLLTVTDMFNNRCIRWVTVYNEHDWDLIHTDKATCSLSGVNQYECVHCRDQKEEKIPALGHHFSDWIITRSATTFRTGIQTRSCTECGNRETKVIPKLSSAVIEKITITKKPTIKKPAATKNKITINWKHFKHTSKKTKPIWNKIKKVQVQCATDKSFKNIVKTTLVGKKKTKATIKGLAKKTTYYVRVRYYDGTGYSAWSKVKKVKTK